MPNLPLQRHFKVPTRPVAMPSSTAAAAQPVALPQAVPAVPVPEPAAATAPDPDPDLMERRHFVRTIPVAEVRECDEDESWAIWSHWSNL